MTNEEPISKPPISAQPVTTIFQGMTVETGYRPIHPNDPRTRLEIEDQRVFRRTAPPDFDALRRACQQPPDTMPLKRFYDGEALSDAPEWRGTRVEVIAFPLTLIDPDGPGGGTIRVPVGHPWAYWEFPSIDGPCIVARWCHRHPGQAGGLEVAWDGRLFFATQIKRSVHFLGSEGAGADAVRLMSLWNSTTEVTGATPWPRRKTEQEYVHHRGQLLARYCRERGISDPIPLPRPDVAEACGYANELSFRNALNQKKVTTEHIKAEAYRLLRQELA